MPRVEVMDGRKESKMDPIHIRDVGKGGEGGRESVMNPFLNPEQTRAITAPHLATLKATHSS